MRLTEEGEGGAPPHQSGGQGRIFNSMSLLGHFGMLRSRVVEAGTTKRPETNLV
jgi:hypothetical protein